MRLIHCKKCGAMVGTEEQVIERIYDEANEEMELSTKDRKNASSHLMKAKQLRKIATNIVQRNSQLELRKETCRNYLSAIREFVLENNRMTLEELEMLEEQAKEYSAKKNAADEKEIERSLRSYSDYTGNRTKADTTAKKAIHYVDGINRRK